MDMQITVETTFENGDKRTHCLGLLSQPSLASDPEAFGLRLEDAKSILGQIEKVVLTDQVAEFCEARRICQSCQRVCAIHDYRTRHLDTLFGRFKLKAPRFVRCSCAAKSGNGLRRLPPPVTEIFPARTTPQLQRLQAELGARHSFREAARLLEMFLPCRRVHNTTVRNRLGQVAQGLERRAFDPGLEISSTGLNVFLDGAHIRCRPEYQQRHLNVVVGKVEDRDICRRFGLVADASGTSKGQIKDALCAAGWKPGRPVTVFSDGEPALPNLIRSAIGGPVEHILDWFHISMRIRHVEMAMKGLVQTKGFCGIPALFRRPAERLRWWLWHGRTRMAATDLHWLIADCASLCRDEPLLRSAAERAQARCRDLYSYLSNNIDALIDYGARYRQGIPISSSRAEGCVDDIANARMGKNRRMRWSPNGAHRVAITRAAVLDGRLSVTQCAQAA